MSSKKHPIVRHVGSAKGYAGSFTVAGVADAPPEDVFNFICDPRKHLGVISSIQEIMELGRKEVQGAGGQALSEVYYSMRTNVTMFGRRFTTCMKLRMIADRTIKQSRVTLVEGDSMVGAFEGVNLVLPAWGEHPEGLEAEVSRAVERFLAAPSEAAMLSMSPPPPPVQHLDGVHGTPKRSIVIVHQKLKPRRSPPPPFGSLLRGHMLPNLESNLIDLLARYNSRAIEAAP